jgi:hypothetical protein
MNLYSRLLQSKLPRRDSASPDASAQAIKTLTNNRSERAVDFRCRHAKQSSIASLEDGLARQHLSGPNKENKACVCHKLMEVLETRGEYRENGNPGRLPRSVWSKIILYAVDPNGILDARQRQKMLRYGSDIKTLGVELETLSKGKSHQIWHVLDTTGCLEYEMKF